MYILFAEMPRLREETQKARVRAILEAAERCFVRRGFDATTIADICQEAGVSVGAVYSHFDGKEAIVEAICEPAMEDKRTLLDELAGQQAALADAAPMEALVSDLLATRQGASDAALDLHLWAESLRNRRIRKLARRAFRELDAGLATLVRISQARGHLRADLPPEPIAALLVAAVAGFEVRRALGLEDGADDIVTILRALCEGRWDGAGEV
jgi:AcrR family transcriptional regulator